MLFFFQIGPYTEDRELPYWLHCRHWPHGAVIITSLSAAGGDTAGVVAALGYRCTYVCVKYDVRNELLVQKWQIKTFEENKIYSMCAKRDTFNAMDLLCQIYYLHNLFPLWNSTNHGINIFVIGVVRPVGEVV